MKKLLLLCSLTLAACAPVAQLAQPGEAATLTRESLSLLVSNPGPDALTGDTSRPGDGPALRVQGVNLRPDAAAQAWCEPVTAGAVWRCNLPEIPAGQRLRVTFEAANALAPAQFSDAALLAYRPGGGTRPVLVWLK